MMVAMAEGTDKSTPKQEEGGMTLREWMPIVGALLVALVIALGIWAITRQLDKLENQRAQQAQKIENQRAEAERELAVQSTQDEALQSYLDQMSSLILEKDLRESKENSEVRTLARARTLTVLSRLDSNRKGQVVRFLAEADLVRGDRDEDGDFHQPVIALTRADLSDADLNEVDLNRADLNYADLSGANLKYAHLWQARMIVTDLSGAKLVSANLGGADMYDADLRGANLANAQMTDGTYLGLADLRGAFLAYTSLNGANLRGANLQGANLRFANFDHPKINTSEDLEQQVKSLKGATMPNGQKYEDWLKDREDGKNE
jgi:uncharacterized protein YjbI with pentapeptide repeats